MTVRGAVVGVLVAAACQGSGAPAKSGSASAAGGAIDAAAPVAAVDVDAGDEGGGSASGSGSGTGSGSGSASGSASETPEVANGGDQSDDVDAIAKSATSAWQAVIDRDLYLARRGQKGIVAGRVDGPVVIAAATTPPTTTTTTTTPTTTSSATSATTSALTWLVDDTEADGCLAIHVTFPAAPPKPGTRVALTGSWALDDTRHWYWKAESVTELPAGPAAPADPSPPGHGIVAAPVPDGARPVKELGDGNAIITFQIVAPPRRDGDGWTIAGQLGDTGLARLVLPGDRPSYGGHDLRTPDEKWQLAKAVTYWVRVGAVHRPPAPKAGASPTDALPVVHALGAPRRAT